MALYVAVFTVAFGREITIVRLRYRRATTREVHFDLRMHTRLGTDVVAEVPLIGQETI